MNEKPSRSIELHFSKQLVFLGEEVKYMVTYHNLSDKTIAFKGPAKTWEVALEFTNCFDTSVQRIPFGRILSDTTSDGLTSLSAEPAETIKLKPKQKYCFVPETFTRHADLFGPGKYRMKIIDRSNDFETLESNTIDMAVVVSRTSFENLVAIYNDSTQTDHNKKFALYWLRKLSPGISPNLAASGNVSELLKQWHDASNSPEIAERINLINREMGVEQQ